ncbi:putative Etoposide induced protein 2.4 (EI24) [Trypanosoma vivax]|uniref:Uncharacterized protein n=1 Tax=Trypanosoma vivax (strain Y486) TaxID=1055687 RepID=G0TT51_TRYVY|nr:hypothetical protein TRVL_08063 [Trypanosoma vivax]KAH8619657.1 putative Etoposide induced protein 2.4 (EI24) [Trypanosoma vivax]CCC47132.1 conserved hypothetical protein [Trypanosoma vivax Y486]
MHTRKFISCLRSVVTGARSIIFAFTLGVLQSLNIVKLISYLRASDQVWQTIKSCTLINLVFLFSLWASHFIFYPARGIGLAGTWAHNGSGNSANTSAAGEGTASGVHGLASKVWTSVFHLLWVFPMYAITQFLGLHWYGELFAAACSEKRRRASQLAASRYSDGSVNLASQNRSNATALSFGTVMLHFGRSVFQVLVTVVYELLIPLFGMLIPAPLGGYVEFVMARWIYAFYVFHYRLSSQHIFDRNSKTYNRITLSAALKLFESNWAYYLGFSMTQPVITGFLQQFGLVNSWFASTAVASVLFGAHVVLSVEATPRPCAPFGLPVLSPFFIMCGEAMRLVADSLRR